MGDPRGADRDPEVVAVRERVAVRALVGSTGPEVREPNLRSPRAPPIRTRRIPGIESAGSIVLPREAEVPGGRAAVDLRHVVITEGIHEGGGGPVHPIVRGTYVEPLRPVRLVGERIGEDHVAGWIDGD